MQLQIDFSSSELTIEKALLKMRRAYYDMKNRCYNPKNKRYHRYGGRGIVVCQRWLYNIENFINDMGFPSKHLQLDRINNEGNYEPSNCKWSTIKEQANNRSKRKLESYKHKTSRKKNISILLFDKDMNFLKKYKNAKSAAEDLNGNRQRIYECVQGVTNSYRGYILKYENDCLI